MSEIQKEVPECFSFLYSNWIFLVPVVLLIYSFYSRKKEKDDLINTKRIYYSIALFMYFVFLRIEDVNKWCSSSPIFTSPIVWSHLFSMLVALLVAIAIDNFIISGYVFKEFGFWGTKFIRDDIRKNTDDAIKIQNSYVLSLQQDLKAVYEISIDIDELFQKYDVIHDIIQEESKFIEYFHYILMKFYKFKNLPVTIDINFYENIDISKIVDQYKTTYISTFERKHSKKIKECLEHPSGSQYIEFGTNNIYIISKDIEFLSNKRNIMISINSIDEINIYDIYPILNYLNIFILNLKIMDR